MAVVSAIDPRLRQRRIAVRRAQGRRRLRLLLVAFACAVAGAAVYAATQSSLLDLDSVDVAGAVGPRADEVRAAAGLETGAPMIELDLDAASAAVTALPWVSTASVERSWPGTVSIEVEPRVAAAALPARDGSTVLIDAEGVAIASVDRAPADLTTITIVAVGELGDVQTQAIPLLTLAAAIPGDLDPWVESIGVRSDGGAGHLEIDLVGSAVANLGDTMFLTEKLEALRALLAGVDHACVTEYDLRVPDIPTTRRDPLCDAAASEATTSP